MLSISVNTEKKEDKPLPQFVNISLNNDKIYIFWASSKGKPKLLIKTFEVANINVGREKEDFISHFYLIVNDGFNKERFDFYVPIKYEDFSFKFFGYLIKTNGIPNDNSSNHDIKSLKGIFQDI